MWHVSVETENHDRYNNLEGRQVMMRTGQAYRNSTRILVGSKEARKSGKGENESSDHVCPLRMWCTPPAGSNGGSRRSVTKEPGPRNKQMPEGAGEGAECGQGKKQSRTPRPDKNTGGRSPCMAAQPGFKPTSIAAWLPAHRRP